MGWQSLGERTHLLDAIPDFVHGFFSMIDAQILHQAFGHEESTHFGAFINQKLVEITDHLFVTTGSDIDDLIFAIFQQIVDIAVCGGSVFGIDSQKATQKNQ